MEVGEMAGPRSTQRYVLYRDILPGSETVASLLSVLSVHTVGLAKPNALDASQIFTQNKVKFITSMPKQLHLLTAHHGFHPVPGDEFIWVYAEICAIVYVCMWRPEGDRGCLPRHGLITETGTHQSVWLG